MGNKRILLMITLLFVISFNFLSTLQAQTPAADKRVTIAVVYFDNNILINHEKYEPLKKGFAAMLTTELAKINKFRIVEREKIQQIMEEFALADKPGLVDEATKARLGKFLGAQLILTGGLFMVDEDEFRVDARIIQTETGLLISTCEITQEFKKLFTTVKDIAKKVIDDLKVDLSSLERKELDRSVSGSGDELIKYSQALNAQDKARQEERAGRKEKSVDLYKEAKKLYEEAFALNNDYKVAKEKIDEIDKILTEINNNIDRKSPQIVLAANGDGGRGVTTRDPVTKVIGYAADISGVVEVKVNDIKAVLEEADSKKGSEYNIEGKVVKFAADVPLAIGANTINISATDVNNNYGQQNFIIQRFGEKISETPVASVDPLEFKLPKMHAVIVGVSKYKNTQYNLNYADADAKLFYDFLKSPNGGAIPDERIKLILNEDANRPNIVKYIQKVFKETDRDDVIIFYFAGHGWAEGQSMYFLSNEVEMDNLIGTSVSQEDIEKSVKVSRAKKAIMIFDACHAGATKISYSGARDIDVSNRLLLEIGQASDGLRIITAAGSNQQSKEDTKWGGGHGAFTWYLVEGLKGPADQNNDKVISLREAFDYVDKKVSEATEGKQRPDREGDMDLVISVIK